MLWLPGYGREVLHTGNLTACIKDTCWRKQQTVLLKGVVNPVT